jgi:hypothetical protein
VDTAPDRAGVDPWQESLERSLARRRSHRSKRSRTRLVRTVPALALVAAILVVALSTGGSGPSLPAARADAQPAAIAPPPTIPPATPTGWRACPLAVAPAGYVNPLGSAKVKPERIDQGVDYAGKGSLVAIGAGRITYLATENTGWPGAFIEYQLSSGADAGCYVFYAEGVTPAHGLHVGDTISAGQPIASIIPMYRTGIEIGWGAGISTKAYAKVAGQWTASDDDDNTATAAGKNFSSLISALGGPPGKIEG